MLNITSLLCKAHVILGQLHITIQAEEIKYTSPNLVLGICSVNLCESISTI